MLIAQMIRVDLVVNDAGSRTRDFATLSVFLLGLLGGWFGFLGLRAVVTLYYDSELVTPFRRWR
jgi:hypothetical protein